MASSDISRFLHQPHKRYVGIRLQQGRLFSDADFNEHARLSQEELHQCTSDLLGPKASPDHGFSLGYLFRDATTGLWTVGPLKRGTGLGRVPTTLAGETFDAYRLWIRPGTLYLAGRRFELQDAEPFVFQRDFLQMRRGDVPALKTEEDDDNDPETPIPFQQLYLVHAWEQEVSAIEDDEIREPALGGHDTSTRLRRMARVEAFWDLPIGVTAVDLAWSRYVATLEAGDVDYDRTTGELKSRGRLQIGFDERFEDFRCREDCWTQPAHKMLGAANVTLRIMLTARDKYVWALDNGAPLYRVLVRGLSTDPTTDTPKITIEMLTPPIDETAWPLPGRVVEILPIAALLDGEPVPGADHPHFKKLADRIGAFLRVSSGYDSSTHTFELAPGEGLDELRQFVTTFSLEHPDAARLNYSPADGSDARVFYCRFWHDASNSWSVHVPFSLGDWGARLGDTGVIPVFHAYGRRGDYWTVALRPEAHRRVVPFELAANDHGVPPHGPKDYYTPLALVTGSDNLVDYNADARPIFSRAVDTGCLTYTVGDGAHSHGDFTTIQDALDALNAEVGGHIVVRRGTYRERLKLLEMKNVVLEACGEQVVIETPPPASPPVVDPDYEGQDPALIDVVDCDGIVISGFHLNAIEERAVRARKGSSQVSLSGLNCRAGLRQGWAFVPGAQRHDVPLIDLDNLTGGSLNSLVLEPSSRQALRLVADSVTITGLTALNEAAGGETPSTPLVSLEQCVGVLFEDSALTACGRVGLSSSGCTELTLRSLSVVVSQHRNRYGRRTQSQCGIDVDGCEQIRLLTSWITMDESSSDQAAVVVKGQAIHLVGNHVEVLARCFESPSPSPPSPDACGDLRVQAWGGIQIRGGSRDIELRENQILGGVGHGITLGSLVWREPPDEEGEDPSTEFTRSGAGFGQMVKRHDGHLGASGKPRGRVWGRGQPPLEPYDEGALYDVRIVSNRIEQMNSNGISVVTVLGFPDNDALIDTVGIKIADNTIVDNLRHPADSIELAENFVYTSDSLSRTTTSSGLAVPGEAARIATRVPVLPLGGVVLGSVTALDVSGNVIVGNGHLGALPTNGIFVLIGEGIRIVNNRIAGNGGRARLDSPAYSPPPGPAPGIRAGIAILLGGTGAALDSSDHSDPLMTLGRLRDLFEGGGAGLDDGGSSVRILGNTIRHPEGRALHVVAAGPVAIVGNFLSSEGNHGADDFQDAYMVGDAIYVHNLGAPFEASLGNEYPPYLAGRDVPAGADDYLNMGQLAPDKAVFGHGGAIQFKDNQVTFDWEVLRVPHLKGRRAPLAYFPVALVCLDHLSLDGNQFAFRLRGRRIRTSPPKTSPALFGYVEPVFGQVLGIGGTVQTANNRFAESVGSALLSLVTIGRLSNLASFNQSTHEILAVTDAYSTTTQVSAIRQIFQGDWSGRRAMSGPTISGYPAVGPAIELLLSPEFATAGSLIVTVTATGTGGDASSVPTFSYDYADGSSSGRQGTFDWASEVTLGETGLRLHLTEGYYAQDNRYSIAPDVPLMAEGTNPPRIYARPRTSGGTLIEPPENCELELEIVTGGIPTGSAETSPVEFRWRTNSGEDWRGPFSLLAPLTTLLIGTVTYAELLCSGGTYQTDHRYRLSVYRGVSPVRSKTGSPAATPVTSFSNATAPGAYRVIVDILQAGAFNSTNGNDPECRYSVDGGRSWSRVQALQPTTQIGTTKVALGFSNLMQQLAATDYFEFETYVPPLSRELVTDWLIRMGNQVLFRPQGTALNLDAATRLINFSKRFLTLLSRVSS